MIRRRYEDALAQEKFIPERDEAMTLRIENDRVPLPTVVQRNRNMNPVPVSTVMGNHRIDGDVWEEMLADLGPRVEALLGRWVGGLMG